VSRVAGRQSGGSLVTGPVLKFPSVNGWGNVGGNWAQSVSTGAATFEAWIRTTAKPGQTIVGAVRPLAEAPAAFAPGRRTPGKTIIRITEGG
jgi:hypothetical protein